MGIEDDFGNVFDEEADVQLTDPFGNPILEGETVDVSAGPTLRSEWLRGVANGDFQLPPFFPENPINSNPDSVDFNPMPGWKLVDTSNGLIRCFWREDATTGSGGRIDFEVPAGLDAGSAFLRQPVPVRSTFTRNLAVTPLASAALTVPPVGFFKHSLFVGAEELDKTGASLGVLPGAGIDAKQIGFNVPTPYDMFNLTAAQNLKAATFAVDVSFGVEIIDVDTAAPIYSYYEVMLLGDRPIAVFPDLLVPTISPGTIEQRNGLMLIKPAGASDGFEVGVDYFKYKGRDLLSRAFPFFMG